MSLALYVVRPKSRKQPKATNGTKSCSWRHASASTSTIMYTILQRNGHHTKHRSLHMNHNLKHIRLTKARSFLEKREHEVRLNTCCDILILCIYSQYGFSCSSNSNLVLGQSGLVLSKFCSLLMCIVFNGRGQCIICNLFVKFVGHFAVLSS